MAVTIKDIAKRVNRSITTVSRALHDYDDVSPETKARVRQIASEMGYTPSSFAQRLQKRRSDTVGVILPTFGPRFSDPFFSEFLAGIGNKAAEFGYDMLVSTRAPGEEEMHGYRQYVQGCRVDGFILVRTRLDDARINYLMGADFPFVAFGRSNGKHSFPFVDEDCVHGMELVVEHLLNLGHNRIACLSAPDNLTFSQFRMNGYRKGLSNYEIPIMPELILEGDLTHRGGYKLAKMLLDLPDPPTAIIASNDLMAIGAMSAVQERGLVVGKDIAITGFDDIPTAEYSHPPLTTLHQPIYKIGRMVCKMLINKIQGKELEQEQIILKPRLIVRQSSGEK